jgi:hypothetical protein
MKNISKKVKEKAYSLLSKGKVSKELETERRIHFKVVSRDVHSVIFDKEKKLWECDCRFFALKQKYCSHILAADLFLKEKARTIL